MSETKITSRQNPRIKRFAALRERSERRRQALAVVYGVRETQRALEVGAQPVECLWCSECFRSPQAVEVVSQLARAGTLMFEASRDAFEKLAYGDRLDGLVSIFEARSRGLSELVLPDNPLVAVIEQIEKPGNLGAILRSADGAGIDAVLAVDPVIDLFNPNAIRASVSAVFQSNIAVATSTEMLDWLNNRGLAVWATRPDAKQVYWDVDFTKGGAVVLGGEANGLTAAWSANAITPIRLPMLGVADSLNVSATAAVLFYEARRQRQSARV